MKSNNIFKLIGAIAVCQAAGIIGTIFTIPAIPTWYAALHKPSFAPPNWLFGPAWLILYTLMGISLFLIWQQHSSILQNTRMLRIWRMGIVLFFFQLVANASWSFLFFGLRNPLAGLIGIAVLWFAIVWTIIAFYKIYRPAAYLFVPYILWVSFAVCLNFAVFILN